MVSLLIKKHDFAVFLTKTHHLKTLYIIFKERTKSVLNKGAPTVALLFNPPLVLSLKIM